MYLKIGQYEGLLFTDEGEVPLFLFLRTVPSSLVNSPLREAEDMLRGPVGFLAGTPPIVPDNTRAAGLEDSSCS